MNDGKKILCYCGIFEVLTIILRILRLIDEPRFSWAHRNTRIQSPSYSSHRCTESTARLCNTSFTYLPTRLSIHACSVSFDWESAFPADEWEAELVNVPTR